MLVWSFIKYAIHPHKYIIVSRRNVTQFHPNKDEHKDKEEVSKKAKLHWQPWVTLCKVVWPASWTITPPPKYNATQHKGIPCAPCRHTKLHHVCTLPHQHVSNAVQQATKTTPVVQVWLSLGRRRRNCCLPSFELTPHWSSPPLPSPP